MIFVDFVVLRENFWFLPPKIRSRRHVGAGWFLTTALVGMLLSQNKQLRAGAGFSMNQKSVSNLGDQLDVRLRFELAGEAQAVLDGCEKIDAHN